MTYHKLIQGDCLKAMQTLESESIDCVVTSPPYWALRDYNSTHLIFGGDNSCEHEFGVEKTKALNLNAGNPEFKRPWRENATTTSSSNGCFCIKCNAWKGALGLETNFNDVVVEIELMELKKDLRKDEIELILFEFKKANNICGVDYFIKPSLANTNKFCSRKCRDKWQSRMMSLNNSRWKK